MRRPENRLLNRRQFVAASAAAAVSVRSLAQSKPSITLHADQPGPMVPVNFVGLSYETQQLSDPTFFAPDNTGLIARFRELSPNGVLRLGGNTSDYGYWKPTPESKMPPRTPREYKVGDPPPDLAYAVTPQAVDNLNAFLKATGWTCLYGINLGNNTPALAASEATYVAKTLGPRLEYFQVGNEADRFASTIRDPKLTGHPWDAPHFIEEWLGFAKAIVAAVPNAKFGLPDVASNATWLTAIGDHFANDAFKSHISCITHHYYVGGPPSNPEMTIAKILAPNPRVAKDAATVRSAADKIPVPYRMTEGNTCYRGGKPGVSDVFAAALWSTDYALELASFGYAGVNLHGGDGQMVANSLGGKLPGEELMSDPTVPHARPFYTPIAHIGNDYVLEPVAYGLKFASNFAGGKMVKLDFDAGGKNATAYAAVLPTGQQAVIVINKDAKPLPLNLPGFSHVQSLSGPAIDAHKAAITETSGNRELSTVPPYTAVLLRSARA